MKLSLQLSFNCAVLELAASLDLEVEEMDVKIVFLHGDTEEDIYMKHCYVMVKILFTCLRNPYFIQVRNIMM